jgi:hypothetical protein
MQATLAKRRARRRLRPHSSGDLALPLVHLAPIDRAAAKAALERVLPVGAVSGVGVSLSHTMHALPRAAAHRIERPAKVVRAAPHGAPSPGPCTGPPLRDTCCLPAVPSGCTGPAQSD